MSDEKKTENDHGIYRIETVPPPEGEDDAYSAPTKIGELASPMVIREMMEAALDDKPPSSASPRSKSGLGQLMPSSTSTPPQSVKPSEPLPRVYEEIEEEDIATRMSAAAKPPALPVPTPRASASPARSSAAPAAPAAPSASSVAPSGRPRTAPTPFISSPLDSLASSAERPRPTSSSRFAVIVTFGLGLLIFGFAFYTCAR